MADPGTQYFKGRILFPDKTVRFVVWDGVKDYENLPPPELAAVIFKGPKGPGESRNVAILQVNEERFNERTIHAAAKSTDGLILWARDHKLYRRMVKQMSKAPWLQ
jgi:hypothetical protein